MASLLNNFSRFACACSFMLALSPGSAMAQGIPAAGQNLSPITLRGGTLVAQQRFGGGDVVPSPAIIPTDITPTRIGEERELIRPGFKFYLMQKLPPRMWFNAVTEVTQRFESNVLFTARQPRRDYVFRVLPNVTLGYNIRPNTSVYCNYFMIKDVYARTGFLSNPTFMSLAGGIRQEVPIGTRSNMQIDFQARQLWQARNLRQADLLPGLTFTRVFTPKLIGFANTQLQLRSRNLFATGTFREIDPFFTVGLLGRWRDWNAIATNTFVANFRYPQAIPPQRNYAVIADFELNRPINKNVPGLLAFFRAEPIWNFGGNSLPGLSGFDFRIFGGIRMSIVKPSYYAQLERLRRQLDQVTKNPGKYKKITGRKNSKRIAQSLPEPSQVPVEMAIDIAHDEGALSDDSGARHQLESDASSSVIATARSLDRKDSFSNNEDASMIRSELSPGAYQIRRNLSLLKQAETRYQSPDSVIELGESTGVIGPHDSASTGSQSVADDDVSLNDSDSVEELPVALLQLHHQN